MITVADPITPGHAARILARAAAIDRRLPDAAADEMWAESLTIAGVDYRDCLRAVAVHYAESADPVRPFHVIAIARRLAGERAEAEANRLALAPPPADAIPAEEGGRRVLAMLAEHRARRRASEGHSRPGVPGTPSEPPSVAHGEPGGPSDGVLTETYPGSGVFE